MLSLSSLGALFFRGRWSGKVITTYSGDTFPTYTPNPIFQEAYASGEVEVEHWSILTFTQRLEAAARGLPAIVTGSLQGSSMASNADFAVAETSFGPVGLLAPLVPDVTLVHGAVADREGNVVLSEPLLEGAWGAWAARRGVVATVERVVESLDGLGHRAKIPAHRVLAVVEAPFGAHPGGLYAPQTPVSSYGEDIGVLDRGARRHPGGLRRLGPALGARAHHATTGTSSGWDGATGLVGGAHRPRVVAGRRRGPPRRHHHCRRASGSRPRPTAPESSRSWPRPHDADAVLAGRGRRQPRRLGGRGPGPGRAGVPSGSRPSSACGGTRPRRPIPTSSITGSSPARRCWPTRRPCSAWSSAARARAPWPVWGPPRSTGTGNLNSTLIPGGPFLVGSGGANDVASRAAACVVVALARPDRLVGAGRLRHQPRSAGDEGRDRPRGACGALDGELRIAAVPSGPGPVEERVRALAGGCGWDVAVARSVRSSTR